jgi:hypothetical protein
MQNYSDHMNMTSLHLCHLHFYYLRLHDLVDWRRNLGINILHRYK